MSDLTPDPLWDGRGSDPELERLQRLLSPLATTRELPPLPDRRPARAPSWVWLAAAGLVLTVGGVVVLRSGSGDGELERTGVADAPDPRAAQERANGKPQFHPGEPPGTETRRGEPPTPKGAQAVRWPLDPFDVGGRTAHGSAGVGTSGGLTAGTGGTFIFYEDELGLSANPLHERTMSDVRLNELVHLSLFAPNYADQPVPSLAREATLDDSGRVLTVALNEALWSDGEPVTAHDVVFTLAAFKDPGSRSLDRHRWDFIEAAEASDEHTLVLRFVRTYRTPPISQLYLKVIPKHVFSSTSIPSTNSYRTRPVTAGPFAVTHKDHKSWSLQAADSIRSPRLEQIRAVEVPEKRTQAELMSYAYGHAMIAVTPEQRAELDADECCVLTPYPSRSWWYLAFNQRNPHLADQGVRTALNLVIDRQQALELIGEGDLVSGPFLRSSRYYNHDVPSPDPDLAQAAALMEQAGYVETDGRWAKDGRTIDLRCFYAAGLGEQAQTVATNMVGQLKAFGINVSAPAGLGGESWEERVMQRKDYDLVMGAWSFDTNEDVGQLFATGGARNVTGYSDARTDQLLSGAYESGDPSEIQAYMKEVHRRLSETSPYVFLWSLRNYSAVSANLVGAQIQPFYYFSQVSDWDLRL